MIYRSGCIIVTPLNNAFKFSGNSCLPAYPGFIVIMYAHDFTSMASIGSFWNINIFASVFLAVVIVSTWSATTDNVAKTILLNSSNQPQSPLWQRPLKIFAMSLYLCSPDQFVTTTSKVLPKSLTVSVFPVPVGPAGAPP